MPTLHDCISRPYGATESEVYITSKLLGGHLNAYQDRNPSSFIHVVNKPTELLACSCSSHHTVSPRDHTVDIFIMVRHHGSLASSTRP